MLKEQISQVHEKAAQLLENAKSTAELEEIKVKILGKKGELTAILKQLGTLSAEERPLVGQLANEVRGGCRETRGARIRKIAAAAHCRANRRYNARQAAAYRQKASAFGRA